MMIGWPVYQWRTCEFLQIADDQQISYLKEETRRINELLKVWFAEIGLKLIDFKLEFGFDKDGKIILADEFFTR